VGDVGGMGLVEVQRDDIAGRRIEFVVDPIAFEESRDQVVGVRADVIGAANGRDLLARRSFHGKRGDGGETQEFPAVHFFVAVFFGPRTFMFAGRVNRLSVNPLLMVTLSENISKTFSPFRSCSMS